MSSTIATYLVAGGAGAIALGAFIGLVVVPVWNAYGRGWQRFTATFLSLYLLIFLVAIGVGGGAALAYYWNRL